MRSAIHLEFRLSFSTKEGMAMAYIGDRPIPQTHPLAHEQISFVPKQTSSSTNSSEAQSAAPSAPMLPAMDGLEEAMLRQAEAFRTTGKPPQAPSPSSDGITPPSSEPV